jgi:hypothetical protein
MTTPDPIIVSNEKFTYKLAQPGEPNEIVVWPASDQEIHLTNEGVLAGTIAGAVDNFLPRARSADDMIPFATALTDWICARRADASLRDHET